MAELQAEAKALPAKVQKLVDENVETMSDTYTDLVKRGERLVGGSASRSRPRRPSRLPRPR